MLPLTKELLAAVREWKALPNERPRTQARISELEERLTGGAPWLTFYWASVSLSNNPIVHYRGNGQHSSEVLSTLPDEQWDKSALVLLEHWECDSKDELPRLFFQFDYRKGARTPTDISVISIRNVEGYENVQVTPAKLALEGAHWYLNRKEGIPLPTGDNKWEVLKRHDVQPFVTWFSDSRAEGGLAVRGGNVSKILNHKGIAAFIYKTFSEDEKKAKRFWPEVIESGNQDDYAPFTLHNFLEGWTENKNDFTLGELYTACEKAWDAWVVDKPLQRIHARKRKS